MSRWQENNGAVYNLEGCLLDRNLHTTTNNFAPNEYRGVVNPSSLIVYKGSKQGWKVMVIANGK